MARPLAPLDEQTLKPAVVYLEHALKRRAKLFAVSLVDAKLALVHLRTAQMESPSDFPEVANAWLLTYLTPAGRATMLAALRRQRAGNLPGSTTMRLPRATHEELVRLAGKLDVTPSALLAGVLAHIRFDKQVQATVKQLAKSA